MVLPEGASRVFPDYWESFIGPYLKQSRGNFVEAYYRLLTSPNRLEQIQAAKAWSIWEGRCATPPKPKSGGSLWAPRITSHCLARIECHYFMHQSFYRLIKY